VSWAKDGVVAQVRAIARSRGIGERVGVGALGG
jgi:hypothetical protein